MPAFIVYLIVTLAPLFLSTLKYSRLPGVLNLSAVIVAVIFYRHYVTSVWCFFAAAISDVIWWIITEYE
jgi:hypothetical protein